MQLTKEEAIKRHRLMWNWIAEETLKQKRCIDKKEAFEHFGWSLSITSHCWCCEYASSFSIIRTCNKCPLDWRTVDEEVAYCVNIYPNLGSPSNNGWYSLWRNSYYRDDYEQASHYAKRIAELPERKD